MLKSSMDTSHNGVVLIKYEPKLNSGSWEDTSPLTTGTLNHQRHSDPINPIISLHANNNPNDLIPVPSSKAVDHQNNKRRSLQINTTSCTIVEESWSPGSQNDNELNSSDIDDDCTDRSSVTSTNARNSHLRSTLNKAKQHLSFDKWRCGNSGTANLLSTNTTNPLTPSATPATLLVGVSGAAVQNAAQLHPNNHNNMPHQQAQNHLPPHCHQSSNDSTPPGESPGGRLSRWFSIRRGSTQQYDLNSSSSSHGSGGRDTRSNSIDCSDGQSVPLKNCGLLLGNTSIGSNKMPQLTENEEDTSKYNYDLLINSSSGKNFHQSGINSSCFSKGDNSCTSVVGVCRQIPPTLPPAPAGLSQHQLKRRHIVAAIVHSENSYVATLQRLVNDYKRTLEESNPPILNTSKICTLFHRLPEILQCHNLFRIALADCVRNWDREEKLGDVFVGSFSKPVVLDIYSGFINNFSAAMELAKMEAKRKSALADFFKVKQISAHDRLSFFGLMVKPVQRFPQFILFLQDLLKYTPQGHHDRMSLQLALTQLESLAEMLNERKREAEQYQAFKEMIGHISGTFNTRALSSNDGSRNRYLLREDNVTQLEFNQFGFIIKSKQRRLLLLNDKVICVSVAPKQSHDFGATEKLSFKWMYLATDVEIVDNSTSATLSRILTAGPHRAGSLKANGRDSIVSIESPVNSAFKNEADNLCGEMSNLMHDYEVMSRINDLVGTLKGTYRDMGVDITRRLLTTIQSSIQKKDEEMAWVDSCCLQLVVRNKSGKEETFTFQTENPNVKKEWVMELRLAQLALDTNNSPAWVLPEDEQRPSTKMPLFVKSQSINKSQHQSEVKCGCYYQTTTSCRTSTRRRDRDQSYLWICTCDGTSSHIAILSQHQQRSGELKDLGSFDLIETIVTSMEFVKGVVTVAEGSHDKVSGDTIWMGTNSRKLMVYSAVHPEQEKLLGQCSVAGAITHILHHMDGVFVSLANGNLLIFRRGSDNCYDLNEPQTIVLGVPEPITSLLPINHNVYAGCGRNVWVLNSHNGEIQKTFEVQYGHQGQTHAVNLMAHSGIGLWVSLKNSSYICLYHTESFKHLQDINIATSVLRVTSSQKDCDNNNSSVCVTALMACKGLLWVGTNVGIALTIPLPRLEGVPIISGGVSISYHAHFGPITFLLPLVLKNYSKQTIPPNEVIVTNVGIIEEDTKNKPLKDREEGSLTPSPIDSPKRKLEKQPSLENTLSHIPSKLRQQLLNSPVLIRRRRLKDLTEGSSKTLPRGIGSAAFFSSSMHSNTSSTHGSEQSGCDVYGLYGDLIFVKEDYDGEEGQGSLMDPSYECLRRSEPELAAIPAKVSTLDRRLRMKVSRPRSLDLSNWSVDSRSSSLYTSSDSEESMGMRLYNGRSVSRNSSSASHKTQTNASDLMNISENGTCSGSEDHHFDVNEIGNVSTPKQSLLPEVAQAQATKLQPDQPGSSMTMRKKNAKNGGKSSQANDGVGRKTIITLMGGRGYINWRQVWYSSSEKHKSQNQMPRMPNSNDAHVVIWEKKL